MAPRHSKIKKTVVDVCVTGSAVPIRDGTVIALGDNDTIILVDDHDITPSQDEVFVLFPSQDEDQAIIAKVLATGSGIALLSCLNHTHDQQENLAEVELFEGELQEFQEVYTYSHQNKYRVLTPGNIMSLSDGSFNHNCPAHTMTRYGSPVFNNDGQLVGICYDFAEFLSAHTMSQIARKIDCILRREYKSVERTFQALRQLNE